MALRFFDTNFYKSPFVRGLQGSSKGLYSFIICDCKASGIWAKDLEVASLYIGFKILEKEFEVFVNSGKAIDLKDGNYFFPDFIEHQYPKGLSDKNPAHINIILDLKKYNLIDENLKVLPSPFEGTKVMVIVKENVKEKETKPFFEDFWILYDYKKGDKEKIKNKFIKLSEQDRYDIMNYLPEYIKSTPDKIYRKHPETFLNNMSWKDEIVKKFTPTPVSTKPRFLTVEDLEKPL